MFSRRDAMKLGAAGLVAPSFGMLPGRRFRQQPAHAQEPGESTPVTDEAATPAAVVSTGQVGPRLDQPIVVKWRSEWLGQSFDPPLVAGGSVYSGSQSLVKLDGQTGETLWQLSTTNSETSQPAIAGDIVFVSSVDRIGGSLQAVDDASGIEVWRFVPTDAVPTQPWVVDDMVIVGTSDGSIRAFTAASGEERWRLPMVITFDFQPIAMNGMVFAGDDVATVYGIDAFDGQEIWRWSAGEAVMTQLVVNDIVYLGSEHQGLTAVDASTGEERWRHQIPTDRFANISGNDTHVCVDTGPTLTALDAGTGEMLWQYSSGVDNGYTCHVVAGDVVYLSSSSSHLYAIAAESGQELWRYALHNTNMTVFPYFTVADGVIYIRDSVDSMGHLFAFGNLAPAVLTQAVTLRGAPSPTAIERGTAAAGSEIDSVGARDSRSGTDWVDVTIGGMTGWIPLDAIDPTSLPPDGELEYVYVP